MPDILGYWDRRADEPNYRGNDFFGNPIFGRKRGKDKRKFHIDFYLIRHAEAEINLRDIVGGRSNHSPLTQKGVEQAKKLGERLNKEGIFFDRVLCSPAIRCIDTLLYSLEPVPWFEVNLNLQELDQGELTNKPRKNVYTSEVQKEINRDPWNFRALGGESQSDVAIRVRGVLNSEVYRGAFKIGVYTHGGAIKYYCTDSFGWNKSEAWKLAIDNTSITQIRFNSEGKWELVRFNS